MFNKISKIIRKVDIFGAEVKFNLKNKQKHQSSFGGVVTIILLSAITIVMISNSLTLLKREQYTIQSNQIVNIFPPLEQIDANQFMIGFFVEPSADLTSKRLTSIYYQQLTQYTFPNGTKYKEEGPKQTLEQCTQEHFTYGKGDQRSILNFNDAWLVEILNKYMCLPLTYQLDLQGNYRSDVFKYSKITVKQCDDQDCYTQDEINQISSENINNQLQISTVMLNSLVNMRSEDNFQYYAYSDYYVQTKLDSTTYSNTNIFLSSQNIKVDYSFVSGFPDIFQKKIYRVEDAKLTDIDSDKSGSTTIAQFYLRTSQTQNFYDKNFYTFDQLFSYIGGITKFVMTLVGFFIVKYNNVGLQIKLANYLYQFDIPKKKGDQYVFSFQDLVQQIIDSIKQMEDLANKFRAGAHKVLHVQRLANVFKGTTTLTCAKDTEQFANTHNQATHSDSYKTLKNDDHPVNSESGKLVNLEISKRSFLDQIIKVLLSSKSRFQYGVKFLFIYAAKDMQKQNSTRHIKNQLFDKTMDMIQRDMDILVIMSKLQEVGKLKHVVLNKTQRKLFNCLPRPLVSSDIKFVQHPQESIYACDIEGQKDKILMRQRNSLLGNRHTFNTEDQLIKLYEAYEQLQVNQDSDKQINQRLSQLLDPTLQSAFNSLSELEKIQTQIREKKHFQRQNVLNRSQSRNISEESEENWTKQAVPKRQKLQSKPSLFTQIANKESKFFQLKSKIDYIDIEIDSS